MTTSKNESAIIIHYDDLINHVDLSDQIHDSLGSENALGILLVQDIPNYNALRLKLLTEIPKLAQLPIDVLDKYQVPDANWIGWSHGKELRASDKQPDLSKGSFYFNPVMDCPGTKEEMRMSKTFWHPNLWPSEVPELEVACKEMANLMLEVGKLIANQCDLYCSKYGTSHNMIHHVITHSRGHKARALHYFPTCQKSKTQDDLCGWHLDNSFLTALTRPLYNGEAPVESNDSGLLIETRRGEIKSVNIPNNCMAFQTGEALQVFTNGLIKATPHCVSSNPDLSHLSRNTLAIFMQPESGFELQPGYTFKAFCDKVIARHH
eukprot:NODE_462_length_7167_cov_0.402518.p2 type:complete len:321 gc:universal NODE_462_length_7167_cov_0.402518:5219-4257(-)